jgi:NTE family protein
VLGGGGARGAAQVGALLALFEAGIEPPSRLIGVSVGALNAATIAAYPSLAGASMLRQMWFSQLAREVFRIHPLGIVLSRLRGGALTTLPASNVSRLIERTLQLTGIDSFENLKVPLQVVATDIGAGRAAVFERGPLLPALQASTAIPGVFPAVDINGAGYLDGGIVDNLPVGLAIEGGSRDILALELMAGGELERAPSSWAELMARTLQLCLHQRMLSDFERVRRQARVVVISPLLGPRDGLDMNPGHVEELIERSRRATLRLLHDRGRRLFRQSAVHYLDLESEQSKTVA